MRAAELVPLVTDVLPAGARVLASGPEVAAALRAAAPAATVGDEHVVGPEPVDVVVLLDGEVAAAGERAPAVVDAAVKRTRPGGWLVVAVPSSVHGALTGGPGDGLTAGAVHHLLAERGLEVHLLAAPGAAAALTGRPWAGRADLDLDRTPGLLDAGPWVLAVGRTAPTPAERSRTFFASIARKIVAASVLCRTRDDRVLVVNDTFKGSWTLPGGLVDAAESPIDAAVREAREEAGVDVRAGALLGVFAHPVPDRVHLIYAAEPVAVPTAPVPLHDHEISEVRWVPLADAGALLGGDMARKVRCCLEQPGATWRW